MAGVIFVNSADPRRINGWTRIVCIMVVAASAMLVPARAGTSHSDLLNISISNLRLNSRERVVGFEFHIKSGRVAAVQGIPAGWDVRVENNPSWNAVVRGSSLVGAAAVDASFFKNFIVIEKNESLGLPFDVSGDIVVTRDFVKERRIHVSMKDATLVPAAPK